MPDVFTDKQLVDIVMFAGSYAEIEGDISEVVVDTDVTFKVFADENDTQVETTVIAIKEIRPFLMEWLDADPEDTQFFVGAAQTDTALLEEGERCYGLLRNDGSAKIANTAEKY